MLCKLDAIYTISRCLANATRLEAITPSDVGASIDSVLDALQVSAAKNVGDEFKEAYSPNRPLGSEDVNVYYPLGAPPDFWAASGSRTANKEPIDGCHQRKWKTTSKRFIAAIEQSVDEKLVAQFLCEKLGTYCHLKGPPPPMER